MASIANLYNNYNAGPPLAQNNPQATSALLPAQPKPRTPIAYAGNTPIYTATTATSPYTSSTSPYYVGGMENMPQITSAASSNPYAGQSAQQIAQSYFGTAAPTSDAINGLLAAYQQAGINATRATHAGGTLPSDDKIVLPDGSVIDLISDVGGPGAAWQWAPDVGGGSDTSGLDMSSLLSTFGSSYTDPDTANLLSYIKGAVAQLTGPQNTSAYNNYLSQAQSIASSLQNPYVNPEQQQTLDTLNSVLSQVTGAPFTDDQSRALFAEASDALTKQRDSDVRNTVAQMAALGQGKGSGTIQAALRDVQDQYQQNLAANNRAITIAGIQQGNTNRQLATQISQLLNSIPLQTQQVNDQRSSTAAQILGQIASAEEQQNQDALQRQGLATQLMQIPVTLGDQRLNQALQVLGEFGGGTDPDSIMTLLSTILGNSQQADQTNAQNNANYWEQVGSVL
jgi:hypothetical protein